LRFGNTSFEGDRPFDYAHGLWQDRLSMMASMHPPALLRHIKHRIGNWLDPEWQLRRLAPGHYAYGGARGVLRLFWALQLQRFARLSGRVGLRHRQCPCCGWQGRRFLPYIDGGYVTLDAACPQCGSHARHRGHRLFYERVLRLREASGRLLYMAPEGNLDYFRSNSRLNVKTSNYGPSDADYDVDIMNIRMPADWWDFIVCHRIIEHVPDDRLAMRELLRILKPGGTLVMSVPITFSMAKTVEYGKPNPYETMHYYNYGLDFPDRIPAYFEVHRYAYSELFSRAEFKAMSLFEDWLFVCKKPR
jgi:SAM-dependent methyltransferase